MDGANFSSGTKPKNPRRPAKPFIIDERPPPIISLAWMRFPTLLRWTVFATGIYCVMDFGRYVVYRIAPNTIPFQPSPMSHVISSTISLVTPCKRFTASNLVLTETAVDHDSAVYMSSQASNSLQHDMAHHIPRRTIGDRAREIRGVLGEVADRLASSIVVYSQPSPSAKYEAAPPKEGSDSNQEAQGSQNQMQEQEKQKQSTAEPKLDPHVFDLLPERWPTLQEQGAVAELLTDKQKQRLQANNADLWGNKVGQEKLRRPNSHPFMNIVSWSSKRPDTLVSSADWVVPKNQQDTSENSTLDANAPVSISDPSPPIDKIDELPRRDGKNATAGNTSKNTPSEKSNPTTTSGTAVKHDDANTIDATLHRFMSVHFAPRDGSPDSIDSPTELRVKCIDATQTGGLASRCTVDNSVLCAPRHRSMLAALAMLPDPLPTHLQVATFGTSPTAIAGFMFKFFAQHLKRLDVVTEPALLEHTGLLDFGLSSRAGPVFFSPADEESFLLRTDKKYDLMFIGTADPISGQRGSSSLNGNYVALIRKSLSSVGVAAFELKANDWASQRVVRDVFGKSNVFLVDVPRSPGEVVMLAGYAMPGSGVRTRHIVHRAEDVSCAFRLPYDLGAHLPLSWIFW